MGYSLLTRESVRIAALEKIGNLIQHCQSDRRSCGAIFDMEFAEDVFDVLADRARGRAKNDADIVIAFAL